MINGRIRQTGLGLSYKQDFDDFNEFLAELKRNTKALSKGKRRSKQSDEMDTTQDTEINVPAREK